MNLTKPGDAEAEAAARQAKREARAARAAAKAKRSPAKKTTARKKTATQEDVRDDHRREEEVRHDGVGQEELSREEAQRRSPPRRRRRPSPRPSRRWRSPRRRSPRGHRVSSISDEVAALRGTRSATLGDLIADPGRSRGCLAAMTVSSLGDWVGFVAVTTLVARIGGVNAAIAISGVMLARTLPAFLFGPFAGVFVDRLDRRRLMIGGRHRPRDPLPLDGPAARAVVDLPAVVHDRVPRPGLGARPRRDDPEPGPAPAARRTRTR